MGYKHTMKRQSQRSFLGKGFDRPKDSFGGSLLKGNPKGKRPLDSKLPIHLTLRAGKSLLRLPQTFKTVNDIVYETARKHGVRIYKYANVGNHLYAVIKISSLRAWAAFIRELTGRIAQTVGELIDLGLGTKFWRYRPHTRIVRGWQKAFKSVKEYIHLNQLEAEGFISRGEIKSLKELRAIWSDG